MKPPRTIGISRQPVQDNATRYGFEQHSKVMSNISFGTTTGNTDGDINVQCWKAAGTTPGAPNTEFFVLHSLTHVPFGFMVVSTDKAAHLYKSTTAWTAATSASQGKIYLKCDVATVAFSIIIL